MGPYDATQSPAVAKTDDPRYPFHLDLPWGSVGRVEVKLSAEDARTLARAITEADQPGETQCPYTLAHMRHWCGYDGCRES